jgi:hypothetical protein
MDHMNLRNSIYQGSQRLSPLLVDDGVLLDEVPQDEEVWHVSDSLAKPIEKAPSAPNNKQIGQFYFDSSNLFPRQYLAMFFQSQFVYTQWAKSYCFAA